LREDLATLVVPSKDRITTPGSSAAAELYELLCSRGALFFQELTTRSSLLPSQVEEALRELAALGMVTADTFGAVRHLARIGPRRRGAAVKSLVPPGRWSCFPGDALPIVERGKQIERWCRLLLDRYGVVFRDLLARESAAPPWSDVVRVFRGMELRGEVRGGRFVEGVGGEQFARDADVDRLRRQRDVGSDHEWVLISAADPLNLAGIVGGGERIPALHGNLVVLHDGRWVAARIAGVIKFFDASRSSSVFSGSDMVQCSKDQLERAQIERALRCGRRNEEAHVPNIVNKRGYQPLESAAGRFWHRALGTQ
jgi:ATP-dependent Lhr-like helicase